LRHPPPRPGMTVAPTSGLPAAGLVAREVRSTADLCAALDAVSEVLNAHGYATRDAFGVRLAVEEALVNALKHGHGYDPTKVVRLRYRVAADEVWVEVEDEGAGFDHRRVADPRLPINWSRPSGRGLLLMRHFLTWVRFNDQGNCVTLCKARAAGAPGTNGVNGVNGVH